MAFNDFNYFNDFNDWSPGQVNGLLQFKALLIYGHVSSKPCAVFK